MVEWSSISAVNDGVRFETLLSWRVAAHRRLDSHTKLRTCRRLGSCCRPLLERERRSLARPSSTVDALAQHRREASTTAEPRATVASTSARRPCQVVRSPVATLSSTLSLLPLQQHLYLLTAIIPEITNFKGTSDRTNRTLFYLIYRCNKETIHLLETCS
jgi:hypothetical protein